MNINEIPSKPTIYGPINGKVSEEHEYKFITTDPNGDDVFIYVDWGDSTNSNWVGPYESGEVIIIQHSWSEEGTYLITARAHDENGYYGFVNTKEIYRPKSNVILNFLFNCFVDYFPLLNRLLFIISQKLDGIIVSNVTFK